VQKSQFYHSGVLCCVDMRNVGALASCIEPDDVDLHSKAEASVDKVCFYCTPWAIIIRWAITWKPWKSRGILYWSGKSPGNCGLPVLCYCGYDSHKI